MQLSPGVRRGLIGLAAIMGISYVAGIVAGVAGGKRLPSDWTDAFVADMDAGCVRKGMPKEACSCLSAEVRATIPWDEWTAMVTAVNEKRPPAERTVQRMQAASAKCSR